MNKLLQQAVATVEKMPEADQELAAKFLLDFANPNADRYRLTLEQIAEVNRAQQEVRDGKIASDEQMDAVWRRFGLKTHIQRIRPFATRFDSGLHSPAQSRGRTPRRRGDP